MNSEGGMRDVENEIAARIQLILGRGQKVDDRIQKVKGGRRQEEGRYRDRP